MTGWHHRHILDLASFYRIFGLPPSTVKTLPTALLNRRQNSGVMGCEPTRPRMPSVPKYFRFIAIRR